ncbi:MAG: hypothetical protein ACYS9C_17315 [Planctomycetota bacterium]
MNREQKMAWVCVICMSLAFTPAFILLLIHLLVGKPNVLYVVVIPFVGLPLSGLICLFIPKDKGKVTRDERDVMIKKNAAHAGLIGAFLFTCFACIIPFFALGPDAFISIKWLPQIWIGTSVTQFFFYSLTIIVDYGRGDKGEKS